MIDPAIHSLHLGPGFCTQENLFGIAYLALYVLNSALAALVWLSIYRILRRIRWCRLGWTDIALTKHILEPNAEEEEIVMAESGGEGPGKVCGNYGRKWKRY
jgi:hypothetical protein